ncbi:8efb999b-0d3c-4a3c-8418-c104403daa6d [Thermothielavioides terrestris]|uniref:8efb999b-0d3c-4a3c-8418-c104403daa6d n=1 Tax=Thermothielavioides terrestris TaxID=2587410 RepID=A0A446B9R8_9PEZI|nr:8efb999b-0d3c-4a3c-8418-c104403daa6d [Thermothielavioides terrestris]
MPPQIKQDLNRSGWETTDFPSVCENCLPANPYVKMLKEDYGAECKLCTRPFTVFSWAGEGRAHGRKRRTGICLTCARLKNACQCCIMDLQYGLPIAIRDKALELVAPGPQSEINREYFAQNNERAVEEGRAGVEQYEKADEKARELLRRLAQSKPYFRKGREVDAEGNPVGGSATGGNAAAGAGLGGVGPIRTRDSRAAAAAGARGGARGGGKGGSRRPPIPPNAPPPGPKDWLPPADRNIMSLFVTGIEDDLPEYKIRDFFKAFGKIKSLVVSHMSHCAFVNYETREGAEKAAAECKGRAVIAGCPMRIRWSVPKPIGTMDREERAEMLRDGRSAFAQANRRGTQKAIEDGAAQGDEPAAAQADDLSGLTVAAPPGAADVQYASLSGN